VSDVIVVIPCHREPLELLDRSVESAVATPGVEGVLLVVDGADPQLAHDVAAAHAIAVAVQVLPLERNVGCAAALNAAIRCLETDTIIARLDCGDAFYPETKTRQLAEMLERGSRASFSGHHDIITGKTWLPSADLWASAVFRDSQFAASTTVFRREAWIAVGGYDESLRYADDWDFALRMQHLVGWSLHHDVTGDAQEHPGGISDAARRDRTKLKRRAIDTAHVHDVARALSHPDLNKRWHRLNSAKLGYAE
jgi:glycosyltransferase involved in cell wall biosynthesis